MEEDSAFLSLIMSDVIWREKQGVGSATHISLAELQTRGMIQRGGHAVSGQTPFHCRAFCWASGLVCAQKIVAWPSRGCPERGVTGLMFWRSGFSGRRKNFIRNRRHPSKHNLASPLSLGTDRPRSPGPVPKRVLGTHSHPISLVPRKRIWSVTSPLYKTKSSARVPVPFYFLLRKELKMKKERESKHPPLFPPPPGHAAGISKPKC